MEEIFRTFVAGIIRWATRAPRQPGKFTFHVKKETTMPRANVTEIVLPALPEGNPEEVTTRSLKVSQGETVLLDSSFDVGATVPDLTLVHGLTYDVVLVDKDAAGNGSTPRAAQYVPSDVTPPSQPGEFGFNVKSEVTV